jgi:hypothetical protein
MSTNTWYLPYGNPDATSTILENKTYFNEEISPIFNNIKHPYNPQYSYNNIATEANHNMMEGQPQYQNKFFYQDYTNMHKLTNIKQLTALKNAKQKNANIQWLHNNPKKNQITKYNPYMIDSLFRALPDAHRHFDNPNKIKGPLKQVVPSDIFNNLEQNDDEYLNERNFQEIYNHPFYQNMKPILEQPFKHLE